MTVAIGTQWFWLFLDFPEQSVDNTGFQAFECKVSKTSRSVLFCLTTLFISFLKVKTQKKNFKRNGGDRFDSLVEQYKKKLMGNSDNVTNLKRSKWFDS